MTLENLLDTARANGDDTSALEALASFALSHQQEHRALDVLAQAARRHGTNARLWQWLALLQRAADDRVSALEAFAKAAAPSKDWTIKRPAPEKVEFPPPEPISKLLMDHLKLLWQASAAAVQVQQQVRNQSEMTPNNANGPQGVNVEQVLTYSPTKINKTEKPQM